MAKGSSANVTIIKRKTVVEAGHHGGAWKVAYADFVTAMMAFFLLMWLLNASDEVTREGLAQYFSPNIPIHDMAGGGDGIFQGSSLYDDHTLPKSETGQDGDPDKKTDTGNPDKTLWDIQEELNGASGEALDADPLLEHIATRITDEGLIIDVFDVPGSPLFNGASSEFNPIFERLITMIGKVIRHTGNPVAVSGHLAAGDTGRAVPSPDPWILSSDRAQITRELLGLTGVGDDRIQRVTGKSDRNPVIEDKPADSRNRRIEIILLRDFGK
ncbi:flagellar motor protein MotB [Rhodobacteraceae bacterium DSL-40]|uniref:flagellar motor protein MotB n=1 Tax=Amaricoccus sp. B4 TaxID=3368557 RepID=UPI000DAEBB7A